MARVRSSHLMVLLLVAMLAAGALAQATTDGQVATPDDIKARRQDKLGYMRNHGIIMAFSWGCLFPAGALAARYIRAFGQTMFYLHLFLQICGLALTIAALTQIIVQLGSSSNVWSCAGKWGKFLPEKDNACQFWMTYEGLNNDHGRVGVTVLIIALLQPLNAVFKPKDGNSASRRYWELFHTFMGKATLMLGIFNVFFGIYVYTEMMGGDDGNWRPWIGLVVSSVTFINITQHVVDKYLRQQADIANGPAEAKTAA